MRENNHRHTGVRSFSGRSILLGLLLAMSASVHASQMGVSPSSLTFGTQAVGTASAPMTVQLTNNSRSRIRVVNVAASQSQFAFSGPALPVTLNPGQSLTGAVIFSPATAQAYSGRLILTFNTGWKTSVYLSGTGVQTQAPAGAVPPAITTQPVSRSVIAGVTSTFSVAATGTASLNFRWFKNGAAIAGATSSSYTTPVISMSDSGSLFSATVTNSAGSATSASATLTVNSASTQTLTVNPTGLAFGNVTVGANSTVQATITNTGNANVTISNVILSGPGFGASGVSMGQVIAPGQTASLSVSFTPATNASATGSVTIASNATNSPATLSLSGTGTQAVSHDVNLSWTPSSSVVTGYNIYRGAVSGGPYTKVTSSPVATTSYVDSNVQAGSTYYYTATSVDSNNVESGDSNEVSAIVP